MTEPEAGEAEPRRLVSKLIRAGRCDDAIVLADELLAGLTERRFVVGVLLSKLAALLNMNRVAECPAVIDALWWHLPMPGVSPAQVAEFHGLAADAAYRQGSVARCVTHLVRGARALEETPAGPAAMRSWVTTATAYSYVGFHRQALAALEQAQRLAAAGTDDDRAVAAQPEITVRQAAYLDQQGDSEGARRLFADLLSRVGPDDVTVLEQPYLGYAIARHRILGGRDDAFGPGGAAGADPRVLLAAGPGTVPENVELRRLGEAVLAVCDGDPDRGLELLDDAEVVYSSMGAAEIPRLRTLACLALGDMAAAYAAQCEVTALLARFANQLSDLFVDGVTVRLDYDELFRNVSRYADEAHTDPLTALPNRRHLERHVADLLARGTRAMLGVADIDHFKDVNTAHGHLVGDQVLQQVAAILSRSLREGDFLARFGGDEFVVVLPATDAVEARHIADRLTSAVAAHHWAALVPGTTVTLTVGLAELDAATGLASAFEAADLLMLRAKHA